MFPPINAPILEQRLQAIRKTTVAFASLFKEIPFIKYDQNGNEVERMIVPIIYGNKEKYVQRIDIPNEQVQITLPRIEYGLLNMIYDSSRRTNQANKIVGCSSDSSAYVNSPIPYNFNFEIVLYTRNIEDANQIMEYILPFFYPDYNIKLNMVPELGIIKNIPISYTGESEDADSTGSYDSPVRSVFRTLTFTARSYIYQPPKYYKPILSAQTNINIPTNSVQLQMSSGNGTFIIGDLIFQGSAYDRSTARAAVTGWNSTTKILSVENITGSLKSNTTIYNTQKTAQYTLGSLPSSSTVFSTLITPTPNTYPVTGPYEYNIQVTDNTK
jgi:hypothetical protein